ncbi:DUF397 domain-containing protein [Actinopolyspora alba]|uniref:DUF397 domain-containing protein n=1 Tax=Actinopolyspora alba TaxID=673379 RepID=UPI000B85BBB4|nr:DUF397 domain-containing protein [Actinopolyspora alba]
MAQTTNKQGEWLKSSYSAVASDNCVEVRLTGTAVGVRDSKNPTAPSTPSPTTPGTPSSAPRPNRPNRTVFSDNNASRRCRRFNSRNRRHPSKTPMTTNALT